MAEGRVLLNVRGVVVRSAPSVLLSDRRRVESPRRSPLSPLAKFSQKEDDLILTQPGGILKRTSGRARSRTLLGELRFLESRSSASGRKRSLRSRGPKTEDGRRDLRLLPMSFRLPRPQARELPKGARNPPDAARISRVGAWPDPLWPSPFRSRNPAHSETELLLQCSLC